MNANKSDSVGERNPTSTKGRSRWKSSSENYLLIAEVRFRVRVKVRVRVLVLDPWLGIQKPFSMRTTFGGCRIASSVVDLSPSQSFILCVAQHLELLCLFLTCLRLNLSSYVLLNTSSRSARC